MQNTKPQKILGKKFVRGKPYYKIKWEGSSKDQCSWQTPIRLNQFKSMINKYEIKNWGVPLEERYFDPNLYNTKPLTTKKPEKKKIKDTKKMQKRKMQQIDSQSIVSDVNQSVSSEEALEKDNKKFLKQQQENMFLPSKKLPKKQNNQNKQDLIQIIDLDNESSKEKQVTKNKQLVVVQVTGQKEKTKNNGKFDNKQTQQPKKTKNKQLSLINMEQLTKNKNIQEINPQENQYQRDLGLILPSPHIYENPLPAEEKRIKSNKLVMTHILNLQVQPVKSIFRIAYIYHLQKANIDNHLYLVEFNNKQMKKMSTKDLIEKYPEEFVGFLERKFRAKCMV